MFYLCSKNILHKFSRNCAVLLYGPVTLPSLSLLVHWHHMLQGSRKMPLYRSEEQSRRSCVCKRPHRQLYLSRIWHVPLPSHQDRAVMFILTRVTSYCHLYLIPSCTFSVPWRMIHRVVYWRCSQGDSRVPGHFCYYQSVDPSRSTLIPVLSTTMSLPLTRIHFLAAFVLPILLCSLHLQKIAAYGENPNFLAFLRSLY